MFFTTSFAGVSNPDLFCTPLSATGSKDGGAEQDNGVQGGRRGGVEGSERFDGNSEEGKLEGVKHYDYVICGGGTAGCVLASRLSKDPNVKVLLIEVGESDQKELNTLVPARWMKTFGTAVDWHFETVPQPGLNNRQVLHPRGKMLGGCSAMNAQVYQRCAPADFDEWAEQGASGWCYSDLKPYFDKAEGFTPNPQYTNEVKRNTSGPWKTGYPKVTSEISKVFIKTGPAMGLPNNTNLGVEADFTGVTRFPITVTSSGVRSSTSAAYLPPSIFQQRSNLAILTGTICTRIVFADDEEDVANDGEGKKKVAGIEVGLANPKDEEEKAKRWIAHGGECVLSLGAFGTPQLLLCSGIGDESTLSSAGLKQVVRLEGVGKGLKDHVYIPVSFVVKNGTSMEWLKNPVKAFPSLIRWLATGTGPLANNLGEAKAFLRADDVQEDGSVEVKEERGAPDLEIVTVPMYNGGPAAPSPPANAETNEFFTMYAVNLKPHSAGSVTIKRGDAREKPVIDGGYLGDERDEQAIMKCLKVVRHLAMTSPLKDYILSVASPRLSLVEFAELDDHAVLEHARATASSIHHPMGSCKMASLENGGVVDPTDLNVFGTSNLRVCDASVFPLPVGGHPCAAVVAVAEQFADMLKVEKETKA